MPTPRPGGTAQDYWARVRSLGELRCRVLACMSADNPRVPAYFDPATPGRLQDALLGHLETIYSASATEPVTRLITAAGLLTLGRLEAAEAILSHLPPERLTLDHG